MKKFLLSLATVLCMGSFASADEVTFDFTSNTYGFTPVYTDSNTKYIANGSTATQDPITLTLDEATNTTEAWRNWSDGLRAYGKLKKPTLTVSGANITQVAFTFKSGETVTADSGTMEKNSSATTNTWNGNATDVTFTITGANAALTKLVITYGEPSGVVVTAPKFSPVGGTYNEAQTVTITADEGTTIYYTIDGQNPSDEVGDIYTAPITVDKTMTIKAIAYDADDNKSTITTETYTIVELYPGAEGDGTKANPFNAAGAYNAALLGSTAEVYVTGTVVSISEISTQFGNATYYISADGTETNQFYIYRGYSLDGQKFTSEDELKVGDKVVVMGKLTTYKDVPQLANGNKLISINGEGGDPIVLEGEGTEANPFTVADVIAINPSSTTSNTDYPEKYWINGYIVGYSSSASNALTPVFNADEADSQTNLILGPTPDCKDITLCVPVQLPAGKIRTELNLQDNPTRLGQEVSVYGNIYKYFSVPGIRNVSDYKLAADGIDAVEIDENAPVEYFNLQGVRVENPANGLYIMRQGDKVVKVIK